MTKSKIDEHSRKRYIEDKRQERYERESQRFVENNQCLFYCFLPIVFIITYPIVQLTKCFESCCYKVKPL